jgi:hypothetical protein
MDSDSEDECCSMCGGKLLIDRKFSVRDVYDAAKSVPKIYKENVKSLKEGKQEGGMIRMPSTPVKDSPEMKEYIKKLKEMEKKKDMSGRGAKGSQQAKDYMAKLRAMRKKK